MPKLLVTETLVPPSFPSRSYGFCLFREDLAVLQDKAVTCCTPLYLLWGFQSIGFDFELLFVVAELVLFNGSTFLLKVGLLLGINTNPMAKAGATVSICVGSSVVTKEMEMKS